MDFITKLHPASSDYASVWVILDRLTKSAHFLPMKESEVPVEKLEKFISKKWCLDMGY